MPYFQSGDIDIYFEASAPQDRPKLLYISGTGGDLRKKPGIFDSALADIFQLLSYDQRGLGRSGKPDRPYTMADYADDAINLLDHLGWERAHIMGVSFGGMVAQELAIKHYERIDRLVLCCSSSGGKGGSSYPLHDLESLNEQERAKRMVAVSDQRCSEKWIKDNPESHAIMVEETLATSQFAADEANHDIGAARQLEARKYHDTYDRLSAITCPTLICGGKYDGLSPPENLIALAEEIPSTTLEFFEGGHMFLLQDRIAFPRIVKYLVNE